MPYLRLSTLALDHATKRRLVRELTDTILAILPDEPSERTTVHFTPYGPDDFASAGLLVADGSIPDVELEISAAEVDDKTWTKLSRRLTDVLVAALVPPDQAQPYHVNVKLNSYDRATYTTGGTALEAAAEEAREGGRPGWLMPAAMVGFAAGVAVGYRWLITRLRDSSSVDTAPPLPDTAGEAVKAGQADPRKVISTSDEGH